MKKTIAITCIFILSLLAGQGVYYGRKGFSLRRVQGLEQTFSTSQVDPETKNILSQDFTYLGRGRQCFAFASKDEKYVLKFPRTDIYRVPFWARAFGSHVYQKTLFERKEEAKRFLFESFHLAKDELQDITGILFSHLGKSKQTTDTLSLIDALGFKHTLPIHASIFILQKKQSLWTAAFLNAETKKEKERILNALVEAIVKRAQKEILNSDRTFLSNYGFDGKVVYQIDVGSFFLHKTLTPEEAYQKSARDSLEPVHEWLKKKDPEILPTLNIRLAELSSRDRLSGAEKGMASRDNTRTSAFQRLHRQ